MPIGAGGLLVAAAGFPSLAPFLTLPAVGWLARNSYSLYLIHVVVQLTLLHALSAYLPLAVLLPALMPLSLAAAEILYRLVEAPSVRWSRTFGPPAGRPVAT